jgi:starch-binding outer membrane protein, SusD/RagB family
MKISKYTYIIFALGTVLFSCKKSYLVQNPPNAVPVGSAIKTPNDMADAVNGMYAAMSSNISFGRDIPVLGDLLADNVYISSQNSGRYLSENNYTYTVANGEAADIYSRGYYSILQANRIIAAPVATSDDVNELKGEAYIARALNYLELVNFFGQPYTVAPTSPGVPLTLSVPSTPLQAKPARATVSAVYAKIISDLDSAYQIMPTAGTSLHAATSEYLSKYGAKAIEARAYLYMGDYTNAQAAALLVVQSGTYSLTAASNLLAYWASPAPVSDGTETIFELAQTTANNNGFDELASIYSQDGYGDLLVTPDLFNLYSATDARQGLIIPATRKTINVLVNNKYSNLTNPSDQDDIKIIRYAEVLLTLAEAYARNGDEPDALQYLNQLAEARDPAFAGYSSSGTQLVTDILTERRKELAFEGLRYFDFTRLNLVINRPQVAQSAPSIATVAVGNFRRILPIPQAETDINPNTKQNPGY